MSSVLGEAFILIRAPDRHLSKDLQERKANIMTWVNALRGVPIVTAAIAKSIDSLFKSMDKYVEMGVKRTKSELRLQGIMRAMAPTIGATSKQMADYALQLERTFGIQDTVVMDSMSKLAQNTKVTGDTFKKAMEGAVGLHLLGMGPLKHTATQVGRALQNPIQGLEALHRSGVVFTNAQKYIIMRLTRQNRLFKAQAEILKIVERRVKELGGTIMSSGLGAYRRLTASIQRLKERIGQDLLPIYNEQMRFEMFLLSLKRGLSKVIGEVAERTGAFIPVLRAMNKGLLFTGVAIIGVAAALRLAAYSFGVSMKTVIFYSTVITGGLYAVVLAVGVLVAGLIGLIRWLWKLEKVQKEIANFSAAFTGAMEGFSKALADLKIDLSAIGSIIGEYLSGKIRMATDAMRMFTLYTLQQIAAVKALIRLSTGVPTLERLKNIQKDLRKEINESFIFAMRGLGGGGGAWGKGEKSPDWLRGPITGFTGIGELGKRIQEAVLSHNTPEFRTMVAAEATAKENRMQTKILQGIESKPAGSLQ